MQLTNKQLIEGSQVAGTFFQHGDLERGWALYSHRERVFWGEKGRALGLGVPTWKGEDLQGKTLLLCYEQSLGELILFSSMIPDLLKMGANILIELDIRLIPLFKRSFPLITCIPFSSPWHPLVYTADYYTLIGNPGYYLRRSMGDFLGKEPYLKAEKVTFCDLTGLEGDFYANKSKIGLSWWSPGQFKGQNKNIPYAKFVPITKNHLKSWFCFNLQYAQPIPNDIYSVPSVNLTQDIDKVTSIIDQCDYIVTISNTVAHLAGALGKKAYVLLVDSLKQWYWSLPWYKSVTVVNKLPEEDWEEVIKDLSNKISK